MTDNTSESTGSIFNDARSDSRKAQFRKIVIIQLSRIEVGFYKQAYRFLIWVQMPNDKQ